MDNKIYKSIAEKLWIAIVFFLVLSALYVSLGRLFIGNVEKYSDQIVEEINSKTVFQITAREVSGAWRGLAPELIIRDVQIDLEGDFNFPIKIEYLQLTLNPLASIFSMSLRFEELKIHNAWLRKRILEEEISPIHDLSFLSFFKDKMITKLFSDIELVSILNSYIEFEFNDGVVHPFRVSMDLSNLRNNQKLQVTVDSEGKNLFKLISEGNGNPLDLDNFFGDLYFLANLETDGSEGELISKIFPGEEIGDVRAQIWLEVSQEKIDGHVDFIALEPGVFNSIKGYKIDLDSFSAVARFEKSNAEYKIYVKDALIVHGGNPLNLNEAYFFGNGKEIFASASTIDLDEISKVLAGSPQLSAEISGIFPEISPHGSLTQAIFKMKKLESHEWVWSSHFNFENLEVGSWRSLPAISNASGNAKIAWDGGWVFLDSDEFSISFPKIYSVPLNYDSTQAMFDIFWDEDAIYIDSGRFVSTGSEGSGFGKFELRIADKNDPYGVELDLEVGIEEGNLEYLNKYLPDKLNPTARKWLDSAILRADLSNVGFVWRGSLRRNMRAHRTMQFFANFSDAEILFNSKWPKADRLDGIVILNDQEISFWAGDGKIGNVDINFLSAEIFPDPIEGMQLELLATSDSSVSNVFSVVSQSPLNSLFSDSFNLRGFNGPLNLDVNLKMDLSQGVDSLIVGLDSHLENIYGHIDSANLEIKNINGNIKYDSQSGFSSSELFGFALGSRAAIDLKSWPSVRSKQSFISKNSDQPTDMSNGLQVDIASKIELSNVKKWLDLKELEFVDGMTNVDLVFRFAPGVSPALHFMSTLEGIFLDLPPPWGKSPDQHADLKGFWIAEDSKQLFSLWLGSGLNLDLVLIDGSIQSSRLQFLDPNLDLGHWVESGWLESLNLRESPNNRKIEVSGAVRVLDVEKWRSFFANYYSFSLEQPELSFVTSENERLSLDVEVRNLKIAELLLPGMSIPSVNLDYWKVDEKHFFYNNSDWMKGSISFSNGDIQIDLDRFDLSSIPKIDWSLNQSDFEESFPKIEVAINEIFNQDRLLGNLSFIIKNTNMNQSISSIKGQIAGFQFQDEYPASFTYNFQSPSNSRFLANLVFADLGQTFETFGYERIIQTNSGAVNIDLSWPGGIKDFSIRRASGEIKLNMAEGSLLDLSPGAASALRVVSIFDLADMLDRLSLSHIFDSGIPFNKLKSEIHIANEKLDVSKFEMSGSGSNFGYVGEIDLSDAQSELGDSLVSGELIVTLPVADNLPWIAALAAGSAFIPVAAGVFVASKIFEDDVDRISSGVYSVSGTLDDPLIQLNKVFDNSSVKK